MEFNCETRHLIYDNLSSFRVVARNANVIVDIMEDFLSRIPECGQEFAHTVIERWIQVRKPKQRLTTTLKLLSKEFGVDFSGIWDEFWKPIKVEKKIKSTKELREQLHKLDLSANYHQKMIISHTKCISRCTQKLNIIPEHKEKIEFMLIYRALPCVNRLFNAVFHEHKGFNNAFVFHMVNIIVNKRDETTQKALN